MVHTAVSTGVAFGILFVAVGASFYYASGNPVTVTVTGEPWAGFDGVTVTPQIAQDQSLAEARGVLVTVVTPNSPADRAGLRAIERVDEIDGRKVPVGGDVIIAIDGRQIDVREDIRAALADKHVGDRVTFTVLRNSGSVSANLTITLGERPQGAQ
ncbi:PDZ domain-containing protein [Nitrososphaera sp.]|uniref:S1C family serine protease n=1 Tax=Nitrososphaera sp. TaxID=1971748 RepID=UPI00307F93D2